jgi:hypothetical protein
VVRSVRTGVLAVAACCFLAREADAQVKPVQIVVPKVEVQKPVTINVPNRQPRFESRPHAIPQKELEKAKYKSPSAANRSIPRTIRGAPGSRVRSNPGFTTACSPVFSTVSLSRPPAVEGFISIQFSVC